MDLTRLLLRLGRKQHLPVLLQSETAECGIVCVVMVANYHGQSMDLRTVRTRFPISSAKGNTLADLVSLSHQLGFNPRALRIEPEYLPELRLPCIVHWDMNHFVVLKQVTARWVILHDPALGAVRLPREEVQHHLTGIVLELTPAREFRQDLRGATNVPLSAITGRIIGIKRSLIQLLLLSLALEVFVFVSPFFMQGVIDQVLVSGDRQLLTALCLGFLASVIVQGAVVALRGRVITWLGAWINSQWKTNLFHHLLRLPMSFFERRHMGDILSRFGSIEVIQHTLTTNFVAAVLDGMTGLLLILLLLAYSAKLTTLVLGAFFTYVVLRWASVRRLRNAQAEQIYHAAYQQSSLMESVRGIQTIKLANVEPERVMLYANMTVELAQRELTVQRIGSTFEAVDYVVFGAQRVAVLWLGATSVLDLQFSVGMLVAFIAYAELFTGRAKSLVNKMVDFRLLRLQSERLGDIALAAPESTSTTVHLGSLPHFAIEVKDVSFRYAEGEPWIIKNCSFKVEPESSVALVGPSGCGKTTMAKLILGLLEPREGTICIGGIDIRTFGLESYRRLFGTVMQEDQLFSGSILDNITFFDPTPDFERMERAACRAAIHDEILSMPMAYQTVIGDMGSALSGGQKQRVLLARALYRDPKYLLLDEATSHLDIFNEERVNAAIRDLQITRIIIAHRPETILSADHVFALQKGYVTSCTSNEYFAASRAEA